MPAEAAHLKLPGHHYYLWLLQASPEYRVRGEAVLLTYQGVDGLDHWRAFLAFVTARLQPWRVKYWTATLESNQNGTGHVHLMLQFWSPVDRALSAFVFEDVRPNARSNDLLGEGLGKKKMQQSIDRGHFYVWADKLGTQRDEQDRQCVAGNYAPCWTSEKSRYAVLGAWPEKLWKARKLDHKVFEEYLYACRDGVPSRRRNFEAAREHEQHLAEQEEIVATTKRLRSNPALFQPFPAVPAAADWLALFKTDRLRYPLLVVRGRSFTGKTEWQRASVRILELKIGTLTHFPEKMRLFDSKRHDGLVLDDVRDMAFLTDNQEKLQGKYDAAVEFASTPGGTCSYTKYLYKVPVVATVNESTKNLDFLREHDWLSNPGNRVVVDWQGFS